MSEPAFDFEGVFDEDYLYFNGVELEACSDADTEMIWRILELEPGMEILDLACGHGRITNRLAQRGCRMTGLDRSALFLRLARSDADAREVTVDYVQGDMRTIPWTGRFDRIINWYTAFGYFDDTDNRRVLAQAAAALKPGGRLVIEVMNHSVLLKYLESAAVYARRGSDSVTDERRLDLLTNTVVIDRTTIRDGRTRHTAFFVRMFTYTELRDWLLAAGFRSVSGYGDSPSDEPRDAPMDLTVDCARMIVIAQR